MTGFDKKCLHLKNEGKKAANFRLEVDFLGDGSFDEYQSFAVAANQYLHHEFPTGFSGHWVRLVASETGTATAQFHYT